MTDTTDTPWPENAAPLHSLEVLECATFVAGPTCGMNLAQLGADVVRVDLPGGGSDAERWPIADSGTSLYWTSLNKGKRSVAIDYRTPAGRELLLALATRPGESRGIFVDNMAGRARLRHEDLADRRPDMISVHVEGFAGGRPAVDYTVNAAVGIAQMTGPVEHDGPVNHVLPAWDLLTGMHAALGVVAAVERRRSTGVGSAIDLALHDVAVSSVGSLGWFTEAEIQGPRERQGNHLYGSFGTDFPTADGARVMIVALTPGQWAGVCSATGTTEVFAALESAWGVDLNDEAARYVHREAIAAIIRPWFLEHTLETMTPLLDEARVLWSPYLTTAQAAERALAAESPVLHRLDQPGAGSVLSSTSPLRWDTAAGPTVASDLGGDTSAVLAAWLGLNDADLGRLVDDGALAKETLA